MPPKHESNEELLPPSDFIQATGSAQSSVLSVPGTDNGLIAPLSTHPTEPRDAVTVKSSFYAMWRANLALNIMAAIFTPLGILSAALDWGDIPTFILNFLAIVPLAKTLDFTTDQLSMRVGQTMGGLLNATFGNFVELIVGVLALKDGLLRIVQASLIGSILSNLLLVLGLCFFCGGMFPYAENQYQKFNVDNANVQSGLLAVVFLGYVIPAAFQQSSNSENTSVLELSRGTAFMLLITYIGYLVFELKTNPDGLVITPKDRKDGITSAQILEKRKQQAIDDNEEEEEEVPITLAWVSLVGLVGVTVVIGILAEFLVGSLEGLSEQAHISKTFIGVILLPIVGNASEHLTAVSSAMRNKMDLVIAVAVGSSMQIALLVTPLLVLIGWMIGQPLTMDFQLFETAVLFVTIFVVSTLISDGRTHWLEGWMLLTSYLIIAVAFYYVKD